MSDFRPGWSELPSKLSAFYSEYHLNTLTTIRPDGRPHVVPVGVTLDPERGCAWIITMEGSRKVANVRAGAGSSADSAGAPVAVCQVDGPRWSTIEGTATVLTDEASVARAVTMYEGRYQRPVQPNPARVAIRIEVDRIVHGPFLDED